METGHPKLSDLEINYVEIQSNNPLRSLPDAEEGLDNTRVLLKGLATLVLWDARTGDLVESEREILIDTGSNTTIGQERFGFEGPFTRERPVVTDINGGRQTYGASWSWVLKLDGKLHRLNGFCESRSEDDEIIPLDFNLLISYSAACALKIDVNYLMDCSKQNLHCERIRTRDQNKPMVLSTTTAARPEVTVPSMPTPAPRADVEPTPDELMNREFSLTPERGAME